MKTLKAVANHRKATKPKREKAFKYCYLTYTKSQLQDAFGSPILKVDISTGKVLVDKIDRYFSVAYL